VNAIDGFITADERPPLVSRGYLFITNYRIIYRCESVYVCVSEGERVCVCVFGGALHTFEYNCSITFIHHTNTPHHHTTLHTTTLHSTPLHYTPIRDYPGLTDDSPESKALSARNDVCIPLRMVERLYAFKPNCLGVLCKDFFWGLFSLDTNDAFYAAFNRDFNNVVFPSDLSELFAFNYRIANTGVFVLCVCVCLCILQ
jgi:hypothetical protein